jgi:hypothetical protein
MKSFLVYGFERLMTYMEARLHADQKLLKLKEQELVLIEAMTKSNQARNEVELEYTKACLARELADGDDVEEEDEDEESNETDRALEAIHATYERVVDRLEAVDKFDSRLKFLERLVAELSGRFEVAEANARVAVAQSTGSAAVNAMIRNLEENVHGIRDRLAEVAEHGNTYVRRATNALDERMGRLEMGLNSANFELLMMKRTAPKELPPIVVSAAPESNMPPTDNG